jgi:hypothetical protein
MRHAAVATVIFFGAVLAGVSICTGQPFPSRGSPNPAMIGEPAGPAAAPDPDAPAAPPAATAASPLVDAPLPGGVPPAAKIARTTAIPKCSSFVDAAAAGGGAGTAQQPHKSIAAAVTAAKPGAVICVAEGTYAETLAPGEKPFTLAGGFQRGKGFKIRDSAAYVSKAQGRGGSFINIQDPGPKGDQLTAIDGFEITGYAQAIVRDVYYSQRFDVTNNFIHHNTCADPKQVGAGFALNNVSGTIGGNVFETNACARGGAGFLNDAVNENAVSIENNWIHGNSGTEPDSAHGGALYLFGKVLRVTGNLFTDNAVTGWGAGLYVGANTPGGQPTSATLAWNVYRGNRAGNGGGGFFCDDGATCLSDHEIYDRNCGGNILLDGGSVGSGPTVAKFDHLTNVGALDVGCDAPGAGVRIDKDAGVRDSYAFTNAIFWGNGDGRDFVATCNTGCGPVAVSVTYSMTQAGDGKGGIPITFGPGWMAPVDPLFVAPATGDFHLKSTAGHWTAAGYVADAVTSPAIGKGDPRGDARANPERAGRRGELGAFGNSAEASYVR